MRYRMRSSLAKLGGALISPHLLWRPSQLTELAYAERIVTLRQSNTTFIPYQVTVIKIRDGEAQRSIKQNLPRRRLQQICPAHHFRNAHGGVVHNHCKLIGGNIIPPPDNEVSEVAPGYHRLRTEVDIPEGNLLSVRNPKAPVESGGFRLAGTANTAISTTILLAAIHLCVFWPALAGINRLIICVIRRSRCRRYILPGACAWIDRSAIAQPLPRCEIEVPPLALRIRTGRPAAIRPLLPGNS